MPNCGDYEGDEYAEHYGPYETRLASQIVDQIQKFLTQLRGL